MSIECVLTNDLISKSYNCHLLKAYTNELVLRETRYFSTEQGAMRSKN